MMAYKHCCSWIPVTFLAFVLAFCGPARADRGMIRPRVVGDVTIEEPAQRAIIVHNGLEELLILQTDLRADEETRIVEFMPLPAKPVVSLASTNCFPALAALVKSRSLKYYQWRGRSRGRSGLSGSGEAVKVVVAAELGPHAVTVAEVKDADAFTEWVAAFFKDNDLGEPLMDDSLRDVVAGYLERKVRFFAFDIVTVPKNTKTVQPLTYRFVSPDLYYPLVVSTLYGGDGAVELFMVTPIGMQVSDFTIQVKPQGFMGRTLWPNRILWSQMVQVAAPELRDLDETIPELMDGRAGYLRAMKYEGMMAFEKDIVQPLGFIGIAEAARSFAHGLETRSEPLLYSISSVPLHVVGQGVCWNDAQLAAALKRVVEVFGGRQFPVGGLNYHEANLNSDRKEQAFWLQGLSKEEQAKYFGVLMPEGWGTYVGVVEFKDEKGAIRLLLWREPPHFFLKIVGIAGRSR